MDLRMQSNLGHFTVIMSLKQTRHQYQMFTTSRKSLCTSFKILFYSGCLIWRLKLTMCTSANWYARGLQISGSIVNNFLPATHGMIISNDGLHTGELWQQSSDCASISMQNPLSPVECAEVGQNARGRCQCSSDTTGQYVNWWHFLCLHWKSSVGAGVHIIPKAIKITDNYCAFCFFTCIKLEQVCLKKSLQAVWVALYTWADCVKASWKSFIWSIFSFLRNRVIQL